MPQRETEEVLNTYGDHDTPRPLSALIGRTVTGITHHFVTTLLKGTQELHRLTGAAERQRKEWPMRILPFMATGLPTSIPARVVPDYRQRSQIKDIGIQTEESKSSPESHSTQTDPLPTRVDPCLPEEWPQQQIPALLSLPTPSPAYPTEEELRVDMLEREVADIKAQLVAAHHRQQSEFNYPMPVHQKAVQAEQGAFPPSPQPSVHTGSPTHTLHPQKTARYLQHPLPAKITKPRAPTLCGISAASTVPRSSSIPASVFVRTLHQIHKHKPDEQHMNTMRDIVMAIPHVKLRCTDTILDSQGQWRRNRFWDEIYSKKRMRPTATTHVLSQNPLL